LAIALLSFVEASFIVAADEIDLAPGLEEWELQV